MTERQRMVVIGGIAVAGVIVAFLWIQWMIANAVDGVDQSGTPVGWDFRAFHSAATNPSQILMIVSCVINDASISI